RFTGASAALRPTLIRRRYDTAAGRLAGSSAALTAAARHLTARARGRLDARAGALRPYLLTNAAATSRARLGEAGRLLASLGPEQVLARGYALVLAPDGHLIAGSAAAARAPRLTIRFADGDTDVVPARAGRTPARPQQESLF
ncbi:hypothetical protein IP88_14095, partial [alpha proteobacterium AAP81b]